jgi:hypothetical protein
MDDYGVTQALHFILTGCLRPRAPEWYVCPHGIRLRRRFDFFDCARRDDVPWALWLFRETRRTPQPRRQFDSGPSLRWDIRTLRVDSHRGRIRASRVRRRFRSTPIEGRILRLRSALQCGRDEPPEGQLLARPSGRTDRTRTAQATLTAQLGIETHFSGNRVNQDPAHEIAGLEYLFANKKDFGGDDNARQKLGSVLI